MSQRIGIGLLLASVSMVVAGLVEMRRLSLARQGRFTPDGAVDMSVFWQTIQYVLVGASEVFAAIGQIELFYDQAPDSMRSCSSALALLSTAAGGYIAGGLIPLANAITQRLGGKVGGKWIPADLNKGHLDYFFFAIAALNALNFLYFLWEACRFKYKHIQHGSGAGEGKGAQARGEAAAAAAAHHSAGVSIPQRRRRSDDDLERTPIRSLMPMGQSPALPGPLR